jgi:hypothetical protein
VNHSSNVRIIVDGDLMGSSKLWPKIAIEIELASFKIVLSRLRLRAKKKKKKKIPALDPSLAINDVIISTYMEKQIGNSLIALGFGILR